MGEGRRSGAGDQDGGDHVRRLSAAATRVHTPAGLTATLGAVARAAVLDLGCTMAAVACLDHTGEVVAESAGPGDGDSPAPGEELARAARAELGPEASAQEPLAGEDRPSGEALSSLVGSDGSPVAVWVLKWPSSGDPSAGDLALLEAVSEQAGLAVEHALSRQRRAFEHEEALAEARIFRAAFETSVSPMARLALSSASSGRIMDANPACARMLGVPVEELRSSSLVDLVAPEDREAVVERLAEIVASGEQHARGDARLVRRNGTLLWAHLVATAVDPGHDLDPFLVLHLEDVTERKERERRLLVQAHEDPLTGLANRRGLVAHLEDIMARPQGSAAGGLLLYADLDGFKRINDRHGHATGDAVLREVADRLRGVMRAADLVARIGGDEFAIVAVGAQVEEAGLLVRRIRTAFNDPLEAVPGTIGVSLGFAPLDVASDPDALLDRADLAMYTDKFRP